MVDALHLLREGCEVILDTDTPDAELERIKAKAISIVEAGLGFGRPFLVMNLELSLAKIDIS